MTRAGGTSKDALVLVTSSFPIRADGSEAAGSFVADLASALARETPLRVVAPGARADRESWADGIEVFRYAAPAEPLSTLRPWHPAEAAWILRVLRGGAAAAREALGDDGSHVLALWGLPCGEWARRAARARNVAYSVWLLGSDVWSLGRIPFVRGTLARVIREASRAYADGYRLGDHAGGCHALQPGRVLVALLGMPLASDDPAALRAAIAARCDARAKLQAGYADGGTAQLECPAALPRVPALWRIEARR